MLFRPITFPMDVIKDETYQAPGECHTRTMTAAEREMYPPQKRRRKPFISLEKGRAKVIPQPTTRFSIEPGQNWREVLTPEMYRELKMDNWRDAAIAKVCGVGQYEFTEFKRRNGLIGISLKKEGSACAKSAAR